MLEKDRSPKSIMVRISGYATLVFLFGFILSLILTISFEEINEEGETIYPGVGLAFNFIFALGFVMALVLFLFFFFTRFAKRANGPALKMKPKEEFQDEYQAAELIDEVTIQHLDYHSFFIISWHTFMKDIIVMGITSLISLFLALYLYLNQIQTNLAYALFVLFAVSFLIAMFLLFLMPLSERKKQKYFPKDITIYQNKLVYQINDISQEYTFSMGHKAYISKNSVIFIFYRNGEKRFIFPKEEVEPKTYEFLLLKAKQVQNNS